MTEKEKIEGSWKVEVEKYNRVQKPFALDKRGMITSEKDFVVYSQFNKIYCRKVWGVRCYGGNYEVKVLGKDGGWKRDFYKLAYE